MTRLASILLAFSCSACGLAPDHENDNGLCANFRAEISRNPSVAAATAAEAGDYRFLAAEGFATRVPGVEDSALIGRYGYVVLEGTTDSPIDASCEAYQSEAIAYAEAYNARMLEEMEQ